MTSDHQKSIKQFKIVIEKHPDGYVAYPIGVVGAIVGQGDTYEEALSDVKSAVSHSECLRQRLLY